MTLPLARLLLLLRRSTRLCWKKERNLFARNAITNLYAPLIANKTGHFVPVLTVPTAMQYELT